jgi:hypothetical protein
MKNFARWASLRMLESLLGAMTLGGTQGAEKVRLPNIQRPIIVVMFVFGSFFPGKLAIRGLGWAYGWGRGVFRFRADKGQ